MRLKQLKHKLGALREDRRTVMHFHVPLVFTLIAGAIFLGCRRQKHKNVPVTTAFHTTETVINRTCVSSSGKKDKDQSLL